MNIHSEDEERAVIRSDESSLPDAIEKKSEVSAIIREGENSDRLPVWSVWCQGEERPNLAVAAVSPGQGEESLGNLLHAPFSLIRIPGREKPFPAFTNGPYCGEPGDRDRRPRAGKSDAGEHPGQPDNGTTVHDVIIVKDECLGEDDRLFGARPDPPPNRAQADAHRFHGRRFPRGRRRRPYRFVYRQSRP